MRTMDTEREWKRPLSLNGSERSDVGCQSIPDESFPSPHPWLAYIYKTGFPSLSCV